MTKSEFVIVKHEAKRAGLHYDFRFRKPKSKMWDSFAVRKGVPTKTGEKVLAVKTTEHTEKEARLTGVLSSGYGAGKFTMQDDGKCEIMKYSERHISIKLYGRKFKGTYHLFNIQDPTKKSGYYLFKGRG
jgi:bifunctional non-homologous end joining protein LigD